MKYTKQECQIHIEKGVDKMVGRGEENIPCYNNELDGAKKIGKTIICELCGKRHRVFYARKVLKNGKTAPGKTMGFVKCGARDYLVSLYGLDIRDKFRKERK